MLQLNEEKNTVYLLATEKLSEEDYNNTLPVLEDKIEEYGKINMLFHMQDFDGWTPHALWKDIHFDLKNINHVNKVAIVGDEKWQKIMADLMKPFTNAEVAYFDEENSAEAKNWIDN